MRNTPFFVVWAKKWSVSVSDVPLSIFFLFVDRLQNLDNFPGSLGFAYDLLHWHMPVAREHLRITHACVHDTLDTVVICPDTCHKYQEMCRVDKHLSCKLTFSGNFEEFSADSYCKTGIIVLAAYTWFVHFTWNICYLWMIKGFMGIRDNHIIPRYSRSQMGSGLFYF